MPISWFACDRPESMFDLTRINAFTISGLPTAIPTRQPVMFAVFDSEWNSMAMSIAPSAWSTLGAT